MKILYNRDNKCYFLMKPIFLKTFGCLLNREEIVMESILQQVQYTDENDFFSDLNISVLMIRKRLLVECNHLAMTMFHLGEKEAWRGKELNELIDDHPLAKVIAMTVEKAMLENKTVSNYWDEAETYYVQAKKKTDDLIIVAVQNRTHEKKYEELLFQNKQLESVSHLAAGVAHELRNPLSVIQGFIQLSSITENFNRFYDTMLSEITRMNQIIEDFLSIARKKVEKKKVKPAELLDSITALIRTECLLHGIHFDYKLHNNDGYLYVNESMMKQVMLNLLRNTIEAYEDDTKNSYFRFHAGKDDEKFIMLIEDNGPGMSEAVIASLGNPFYTTKETGTGIGIPMCKKIIKEHDGEFLIESTEKKGTKITIQLPLLH